MFGLISSAENPHCIGSGYCCKKALCWVGLEVHGTMKGPCPSLVYDEKEDRHWCGEILNAEGERKQQLMEELYVGAGCCANLNSDRQMKLIRLRTLSSSPSRDP